MDFLFILLFLILMFVGVPVAFALGIASALGLYLTHGPVFLTMVPQRMFAGIDKFALLAIPLFLLAAEIMNASGITSRIIAFANLVVGWIRGGLAQVNIFASVIFAGISGSAVADTAGLGSVLIPAMKKDGYSGSFAAAVTAASSIIAPIIPPSIIRVLYAYVVGVPVAALFLAGFVPGLLMWIAMATLTFFLVGSRRYRNPDMAETAHSAIASSSSPLKIIVDAVFPILTPVIIVVGILGGVFTPTESAAAAVFYGLFVALFVVRGLSFRDLPAVFLRTAKTSATILLLIATASLFGWLITLGGIPQLVGKAIFAITDNPILVLLLINVFLLVIGMFLDAGPAILILGPVLAPLMGQIGVDPVHFAIVMCLNLSIGLVTPPMGIVLFVSAGVSGEPVGRIARDVLPYLAILFLLLLLVTYVPAISLTLPNYFGY